MSDESRKVRSKIDPGQKPFEISEWPFYHLARVTSAYSQRLDMSLKPIGIDVPRWRVLAILDKQKKARITELAEEAVTKLSTMAKIVQRMHAEGLVEVQASPSDARASEVTLSAKGHEMLEQVQAKVAAIGRLAFQDIPDQDLRQLNATTRQIYDNLLI